MYYYGPHKTELPNGQTEYRTGSPWSLLARVQGAICEDGKPRLAYVVAEADTAWTLPAQVKAKGKTVTGYLSSNDGVWHFTAYATGKNARLVEGTYDENK